MLVTQFLNQSVLGIFILSLHYLLKRGSACIDCERFTGKGYTTRSGAAAHVAVVRGVFLDAKVAIDGLLVAPCLM